jgi:hypothetical protein
MKSASPSSGIAATEDFLLGLVSALAREAAKRDHDAAELAERSVP